MRRLYKFPGGIHLAPHKKNSTQQAIITLPLPSHLKVPLRQSAGGAPSCLVKVGEHVKKGQKIAQAHEKMSVAAHAPTSGVVAAIESHPIAHPSGLSEICVVIIPDGYDQWVERRPINLLAQQYDEVCDYLQDMGIVGLGGAVFPSHLKLHKKLDSLIINGVECEPYISCDDLLMRERADAIISGIHILNTLLQPKETLIGIEEDKPEAIAAMQKACKNQPGVAKVIPVPSLYPSGGAKQLIKLLTNQSIPHGVHATTLGIQCFNIATVYSIYRALVLAEPVLSRVITVTGNVYNAANYEVLIGTPLDELVWHAAPKDNTEGYIMGGSMMGFRVPTLNISISKASNCFIAIASPLSSPPKATLPCIRCGQCAQVCPMQLQPQELYWFAQAKNITKAQEGGVLDCIECGICAHVCPSNLPLVDYYRFIKSEIQTAHNQQKSADQARTRYSYRTIRLERETAEKYAHLAAKAPAKPTTKQ